MITRSRFTLTMTDDEAFGLLRDLTAALGSCEHSWIDLCWLRHEIEKAMTSDDRANYKSYCRDKSERELRYALECAARQTGETTPSDSVSMPDGKMDRALAGDGKSADSEPRFPHFPDLS